MNLDEASAPRWATPRQQRRLEQSAEPITDPLAQDYAVWRRSMLLAGVAVLILQVVGAIASAKAAKEPGADQAGQSRQQGEPQTQAEEEPELPGQIGVVLWIAFFVLSLVLLAASTLVSLAWARPLLRRDTPAGAARTVRALVWTQRGLSWTGSHCWHGS